MKKEKINYKFIAVPQKLYKVLDNNCKIVMTALIELDSVFADNDGWFFRSNSDLIEETKLSKNLLNAVLVTLNRNNLLEVHKPNRNVNTNSYRINFDEITRYDSISFEELKKIEIKTLNYKDPSFKVTFTEVHPVNTSKDNSSPCEQGEVHVVNNQSSPSEHNNILYNIKDNSNNNINNNIDNNNSNNIDNNNNNIYYSVHAVNNTKVNCFLTKEEIESYDNSNYNNLKKEELKENIDNSNLVNNTANAELESNNLDNSNNVKPVTKEEIEEENNSVNSNLDNWNKEESKELDNSNNVNTAVLSPSNSIFEESVISTEKMPENSLKQAKTRELGIVNKTDNSNSVNSKEKLEGNNNLDNSNKVNSETNIDNSNSVKPVTEEIESNNSVNSNEGISNSIAEGDNPTAYAVQEFRNKCTKYTIIIEGKETEIDQPIEEYIRCYYYRIMNTIYNTNDFNKKRKIFNKILNENKLFGEQYDQMCDNLDVRYSRYVQLDKQANKQTEKEEFSNEEVQYIANELLQQCLNFMLTSENNMQDFYDLRNNYNAFIKQYNIPKEGLKLQEKFAELSAENKALNSPVKSQSFAN